MEDLLALAASPQAWAALATLVVMEVVLGIDNLIFISILTNKLPEHQRSRARRVGIGLAVILRLGLLASVAIIAQLTEPLFTLVGHGFSWRDLILIAGGLFLIGKSTLEIHRTVEGDERRGGRGSATSLPSVIVQILLLDLVFSLDSVITAVGMVPHVPIMITAMVLAVIVMLVFADAVSGFINRHPSMKVLALSFLLLIGVLLVADSFDRHINKGYVYFAMAFSVCVEMLNLRMRKRAVRPVELHDRYSR